MNFPITSVDARPIDFDKLPDQELEDRLKRLTTVERKTLTLLLAHLGEFDRRRLYADRGQPSLFQYCVSVLGYSEQASYKRIQAARAAREHPVLLERLWRGELHLAAIVVLAPHLRKENLHDLLAAARGKSKQELEILAAGLAPRPDSRELLRAMPVGPPGIPAASTDAQILLGVPKPDEPPRIEAPAAPSRAGSREQLEPLSPERFLFRFTGSAALRAKYVRAAALLRGRRPGRNMEDVFDAALDVLLDHRDPECRLKRREARAKRSGTARSASRTVPRALRDEVWRRDAGRCASLSPEGRRCPATSWLEIDHIRPYALGGRSDDLANLRLLCRAHNLLMARRIFARGRDYPRG